jgi:hypothetical protein
LSDEQAKLLEQRRIVKAEQFALAVRAHRSREILTQLQAPPFLRRLDHTGSTGAVVGVHRHGGAHHGHLEVVLHGGIGQ